MGPGPLLPGHSGQRADWEPWKPPPPPLKPEELQRGAIESREIPDEQSHDPAPFVNALQQWSALPALGHFLTAAMRCRELSYRIRVPSVFRPPPRLTLTDQRRAAWLADLANRHVPLRRLARAVPHGLAGRTLLDAMLAAKVPITRAIWFVRCVGTNELRSLRRKSGVLEGQWHIQWTQDVLEWFDAVAESYGSSKSWQQDIAYATRLVFHLAAEHLIHGDAVTSWIEKRLDGPCHEHLCHVLWPLWTPKRALGVLRAAAKSDSQSVVNHFAATHSDEFFVEPEIWPELGPLLEKASTQKWLRVRDRVLPFLVHVPASAVDQPEEWAPALRIGRVLDAFTVPYKFADLVSAIKSSASDAPPAMLMSTLLQWTVRRGDPSSVQLCVALCRRLARSGVAVNEYLVAFLMGNDAMTTSTLYDLVAECWRVGLFNLDTYLYRLIASGTLYASTSSSERQRCILRNLPLCAMAASTRAQTLMLLKESPPAASRVEVLVDVARNILAGNTTVAPTAAVKALTKSERMTLAREMMAIYDKQQGKVAEERLEPFVTLLDLACGGSIAPFYHFLAATLVTAPSTQVVAFAVRQVHTRLLTFVCAGLIDALVARFVDKTRNLGTISMDLVRPLQSVVHSPALLLELNKMFMAESASRPFLPPPQAPTPAAVENFDMALDAAIKGPVVDMVTLFELKEDREHAKEFQEGVLSWIHTHSGDYRAVLRLVTYGVVSIAAIDGDGADIALIVFLLLVPANQVGLIYEEIVHLEEGRREFLVAAPLPRLLDILIEASRDVERPSIARVALAYPDIYIDRIVRQSLGDVDLLERLRRFTTSSRSFLELLRRCNPFNLRYYQGMVLVALADMDPSQVAKTVLDAAERLPDHGVALRSLLAYVAPETKQAVLQRTVEAFLTSEVMPPPAAKSYLTLMTTLVPGASSIVVEPEVVATCVDRIATVSSNSNGNLISAVEFVVKLAVVQPGVRAVIASFLRRLQTLSFNVASYRVRALVSDALRILGPSTVHLFTAEASESLSELQDQSMKTSNLSASPPISSKQSTALNQSIALNQSNQSNQSKTLNLTSTPNSPHPLDPLDPTFTTAPRDSSNILALENVMLFSRSQDLYRPLGVGAFDLIENSNAQPAINDTPIDLARFETYQLQGSTDSEG